MKSQLKDEYKIIIRANRNWFYIDWNGLIHYTDLLLLLIRRDFLTKYKQTVLGPTWFIIQPLLTTLVFTIIFGNFAKIPTNGIPPILFYLCGLLAWNYFAQCLTSTASSLQSNAYIFRKVYFPRLIVPLSVVISNLLSFLLHLGLFLGFYIYFKYFNLSGDFIKPNVYLLLLPLLLLQTAALSFGVGLWVAATTIKYRDFQLLIGFFIHLWMYSTPIIYPASIVPVEWQILIALNPMSGIVECYRYAFFGGSYVSTNYLLSSLLMTSVIFVTGVLAFNKAERTFVDWI